MAHYQEISPHCEPDSRRAAAPVATGALDQARADMYRRMDEDMEVNCGGILDGECSIEEMGGRIFDPVLEVASGRRTVSEKPGLGNHEFRPCQIGAVM
jgi:altronate dehydratase